MENHYSKSNWIIRLNVIDLVSKVKVTPMLRTYIGLYMGKNEVRQGHFKSCRNPTWPFIKTVESDVKVL